MLPFRRLEVWQRAHRACIRVYERTRRFPVDERFGLVAQMRRAAVSVGSNIVEGSKRTSPRDFAHFVNIAESSAAEIGYQYELAGGLTLLELTEAAAGTAEYDDIAMMLYKLRKRLENQKGSR